MTVRDAISHRIAEALPEDKTLIQRLIEADADDRKGPKPLRVWVKIVKIMEEKANDFWNQ